MKFTARNTGSQWEDSAQLDWSALAASEIRLSFNSTLTVSKEVLIASSDRIWQEVTS